MYYKILLICALVIELISAIENTKIIARNFTRRALPIIPPAPPLFPSILYGYNAATGVLVAIAIPVHLHDQNVFVSYSFEANYNMANAPSDSSAGALVRLKLLDKYPATQLNADASPDDIVAREMNEGDDKLVESEVETTTIVEEEENEHEVKRRSLSNSVLISRVGVYQLIEDRLDANLIDGKKCLLHAICDSARHSFEHSNGVLGHVMHILLTPSTSAKEKYLPSEYYRAEEYGLKGDCSKYEKACNLNILNLFSTII